MTKAFGWIVAVVVVAAALYVVFEPRPTDQPETYRLFLNVHSDDSCVHVRVLVVGHDGRAANYHGNLSVWVVYEDGRESVVVGPYNPDALYSFIPSAGAKRVYAMIEELIVVALL